MSELDTSVVETVAETVVEDVVVAEAAVVEAATVALDAVVAVAAAAVETADVSVLTEDRVLSVLSDAPVSRSEIATLLGVAADQKLTNMLMRLREANKAVSQGAKRGAKWTAV